MEPAARPPILRFGPYWADFRSGELHKNGSRLRLQEKPLRVLELLARTPGELVTREELKRHLWPDDTFVDFETGLNTAVSKLREALSDNLEKPKYIETIPRRGYRFVAGAIWTGKPQEASEVRGAHLTVDRILLGIAVLPFENLSRDPGQDYLSEGMTDALITALSKTGAARVISRTSAMQFHGADKHLPTVARALGVEFVLEGSLIQAGDRVRIAVRLIEASQDKSLWAEKYEGNISDLPSLLDATALTVASSVVGKAGNSSRQQGGARLRIAPEAFDAYLKGRHEFYLFTEAGLVGALAWYEKAIQTDPNFGQAYSAMAHAFCAMVAPVSALPPKELFGKAEALARKALSLDESLAEARFVLGLTEIMYRWNWDAGDRETTLALALDPNDPTARNVRAICNLALGEYQATVDECEYACIVDPFSPFTQTALQYAYYFARRHRDFKDRLERDRERLTGFFKYHILLGLCEIQERRWEAAVENFRKAMETSGGCPSARAHLAFALAASGRRAEALTELAELIELGRRRYVPALDAAIATLGLGDKQGALDWLDRAYEERSSYLVFLICDPIFDSLWPETRFQNLVERMGLTTAQNRIRPELDRPAT